jgi:AmmeMemoRadiSam system protein B
MFTKRINFFLILVIVFFSIAFTAVGAWLLRAKSQANEQIDTTIQELNAVAGVVPHHLLAESIIKDFFTYFSEHAQPETIILLSPDHFNTGNVVGNSFITIQPKESEEKQEFCDIKIDNTLIKNLSLENNLIFNNTSLNSDHGITNLTPFIKKYFPQSKLAPFLVPANISLQEIEIFSETLYSLMPEESIVIASVDFSHYLPRNAAQFHDTKSIRTLINFEKDGFKNIEVDSWQALFIARAFAEFKNRDYPRIIAHSNSADFFENPDIQETTSYFSVVFEKENLQKNQIRQNFEAKTILFTGDIMLDRGVERLMQKQSFLYPFEKINQFFKGIDFVIGNLEGPINQNPPNFPDSSLKFAFAPETLQGLNFSNFNLLNLANNHTCNTNSSGLEQTKEFLNKAGIDYVGDPIQCKDGFLFEKDEFVFLAFNKTFPFNCADKEIVEIVTNTRKLNPNNFLVVMFHWGNEYQDKSSVWQQNLAHSTIDAGADLIIGHHPHVVQEIEEYKGNLIFYSLGNFIFDMYFSQETQQGLVIGADIYSDKIVYRLFPIQSYLSQPSLMQTLKLETFLINLAQKSSPQLAKNIKDAKIEIVR